MIRNNNDISVIRVYKNEHKLTQYANDTQNFLDGSELSLKSCLAILHQFYNMSGLKINVEKTKAMLIGSLKDSELKLCNEVPLDLTKGQIKKLGVNFKGSVVNIWDINGIEILAKCRRLSKIWSKRNLTLFGKITVLKSSVFSKCVHLFMALPNPPTDIIKTLETISYISFCGIMVRIE